MKKQNRIRLDNQKSRVPVVPQFLPGLKDARNVRRISPLFARGDSHARLLIARSFISEKSDGLPGFYQSSKSNNKNTQWAKKVYIEFILFTILRMYLLKQLLTMETSVIF